MERERERGGRKGEINRGRGRKGGGRQRRRGGRKTDRQRMNEKKKEKERQNRQDKTKVRSLFSKPMHTKKTYIKLMKTTLLSRSKNISAVHNVNRPTESIRLKFLRGSRLC